MNPPPPKRNSGDEDQHANYPSERAMHEAGRGEPFERERCEDRKNEQERWRNRNAGAIFFRRNSEGIGVKSNHEMFVRAMRIKKEEGRLRFRKRPSF